MHSSIVHVCVCVCTHSARESGARKVTEDVGACRKTFRYFPGN